MITAAGPVLVRRWRPLKPYRGDWIERLWSMPTGRGAPRYLSSVHGPEGCAQCEEQPYIAHDQCLYYGRRVHGHSAAHCTADSCY